MLIIYYCITITNTWQLKTVNICRLAVSVGNSGVANWLVLGQGLPCSCNQEVSQSCSHLKVWLRLGTGCSYVWQVNAHWQEAFVPHWLFTGGLNFLPHSPLHRAAWVSSQHIIWLPSEGVIQENKMEATIFFNTQSRKSHSIISAKCCWIHKSV